MKGTYKNFLLLFVALLYIASTYKVRGSGCKMMGLTDRFPGMQLENHVTANFTDVTEMTCSIKCFLIDMCQSYNYNETTRFCQASNSTRFQHIIDFHNKSGVTYVGTKNKCVPGACPSDKICRPDFTSDSFRCIDVNAKEPCAEAPCQNEGLCANLPDYSDYTCTCKKEFTGKNCEKEMTACDSQPCANGGACKATAEQPGYICACLSGFEGDACQNKVRTGHNCSLHFLNKSISNYIELKSPISSPLQQYTISLWFKISLTVDNGQIFLTFLFISNEKGQAFALMFGKSTFGKLMGFGGGEILNSEKLPSTMDFDGNWQHLTLTYDSKASVLYRNGAVDIKTLSASDLPIISGGNITIGRNPRDHRSSLIDHIAGLNIYDVVLDQSAIEQLFNGGCAATGIISQAPLVSWYNITARPPQGAIQVDCAIDCA
ncbi:sushi, von Willebrand factor type A, EGF and pentraxin domain-containing protein 1 isoform X2 [Nematostella vectensis]|uniref:sushi, von Willebrand factor type A, EGF and pentraxin domain-containing protein 1 isoform X2 n=1 Tax=Nematostella vectensis TaxID=45351 RepID=UPI0020778114|nr:sushi, von Willebrand factor type A, EGF and pentraxin domain-containing protein 1 isoform X2 [Nematostella vectensis]